MILSFYSHSVQVITQDCGSLEVGSVRLHLPRAAATAVLETIHVPLLPAVVINLLCAYDHPQSKIGALSSAITTMSLYSVSGHHTVLAHSLRPCVLPRIRPPQGNHRRNTYIPLGRLTSLTFTYGKLDEKMFMAALKERQKHGHWLKRLILSNFRDGDLAMAKRFNKDAEVE